MKIAVMPGSFDPFTLGHADILKRACNLFDFVYVSVLVNRRKHSLFTPEERVSQIKRIILSMNITNADAEQFDGLLVDYVISKGACAAIRGIRGINDYASEMNGADLNSKLGNGVETLFLFSTPDLSCVSSSAVKEIGAFGGDLSGFLSETIHDEVKERIEQTK